MLILKCFVVFCYENEIVFKVVVIGIYSLIRKLNFIFMFYIYCIYFVVI